MVQIGHIINDVTHGQFALKRLLPIVPEIVTCLNCHVVLLILRSSQFLLMTQLLKKVMLTSKVVKIDPIGCFEVSKSMAGTLNYLTLNLILLYA